MAIWQQHPDLMDRLNAVQNRDTRRDIVSFAGLCESREELERHVVACEDRQAATDSIRALNAVFAR